MVKFGSLKKTGNQERKINDNEGFANQKERKTDVKV